MESWGGLKPILLSPITFHTTILYFFIIYYDLMLDVLSYLCLVGEGKGGDKGEEG